MVETMIRGMGKYLPETVYTSEEIEERAGFKRLGIKLGLVKMLTGCETRHYAAENEWLQRQALLRSKMQV